jgi:2-keto-3-deoxy-L-rhamnonate aldolase RhmA
MKARLAAGEPALGCSLMFPSPQIVEMLAHAGLDWVLLD